MREYEITAAPLHTGPPPQGDDVALWWLDTRSDVVGGHPVDGDDAPLSAEERTRASRLRRPGDGHRHRAAHIALRLVLGGYTGQAPEAVTLSREPCPCCGDAHGRPALAGTANLHFSLSHSDDLALIAVSGVRIGADVEGIRKQAIVNELLPSLHPDEHTALRALPDAGRPQALARLWTRKEAYLKATGQGLAYGFTHPYVGIAETPAPVRHFTVLDLKAPPPYAAAIALNTAA
ncbi:4'-phosphopantetheinyl transferase family protein [Streptomyces sp. NPDC101132]|uniref:4'-phosphopantetheinyl transferase family protein n=1 Tax=Streptomyces sp. NPDC101132 TaxID=3366110 RepID=UPI00382AD5EB